MSDIGTAPALIAALADIFRPSAPTIDRTLFAGRDAQLEKLAVTLQQPGQHAIVFGDRGVGKTSLANVAASSFTEAAPNESVAIRLQCTASDSFESLWAGLRQAIEAAQDETHSADLDALLGNALKSLSQLPEEELITPNDVARRLRRVAKHVRLLVIVDEFDRINPLNGNGDNFADLIKILSDTEAPCTLFIIGVADSVAELIAGHASIDRNLQSIEMPRMEPREIDAIVRGGFKAFSERTGYQIDLAAKVSNNVVSIAQGFPYYAHLICLAAGRLAIRNSRHKIETSHLLEALVLATSEADASIANQFAKATESARGHATFDKTLMACALSEKDHLGFFWGAAVSPHLSKIIGREAPHSSYNAHLTRFCEKSPYVLEKREKPRSRYRFTNPLMPPYLVLKAYNDGYLEIKK